MTNQEKAKQRKKFLESLEKSSKENCSCGNDNCDKNKEKCKC
jgi:hypothetical protein